MFWAAPEWQRQRKERQQQQQVRPRWTEELQRARQASASAAAQREAPQGAERGGAGAEQEGEGPPPGRADGAPLEPPPPPSRSKNSKAPKGDPTPTPCEKNLKGPEWTATFTDEGPTPMSTADRITRGLQEAIDGHIGRVHAYDEVGNRHSFDVTGLARQVDKAHTLLGRHSESFASLNEQVSRIRSDVESTQNVTGRLATRVDGMHSKVQRHETRLDRLEELLRKPVKDDAPVAKAPCAYETEASAIMAKDVYNRMVTLQAMGSKTRVENLLYATARMLGRRLVDMRQALNFMRELRDRLDDIAKANVPKVVWNGPVTPHGTPYIDSAAMGVGAGPLVDHLAAKANDIDRVVPRYQPPQSNPYGMTPPGNSRWWITLKPGDRVVMSAASPVHPGATLVVVEVNQTHSIVKVALGAEERWVSPHNIARQAGAIA